MYICIYVYMYICIHVYMYICIYAYMLPSPESALCVFIRNYCVPVKWFSNPSPQRQNPKDRDSTIRSAASPHA